MDTTTDSNGGSLREFLTDLMEQPPMRRILTRRVADDTRFMQGVVTLLMDGTDDTDTRVPDVVMNVVQQFLQLPPDAAQRFAETGELKPGEWLVPTNGNGNGKRR